MQKIPVHQHDPNQVNGKIYVRLTQGFFQNLRRLISGSLMLMFFGTVWINLNDQQIVLFDFFGRRIHLFGLQLSPQDLFLLAGFMIIGAVLLFAMAMAYSRIWCGFACPQSIWSWLFIRIETLTEGNRNKRIKLDQGKFSLELMARRALKHLLWVLLATLTAITFIGYFVPIREIATDILNLQLSLEMFSWILIFALLTYINAGLTREKVCLHMCPYSRFQSVMFDEDTRVVSYDKNRGEPRSPSIKAKTAQQSGDCVDCNLCVHVCPTGIDIRQGLQADCIACGACIDACDIVMKKLGRKTGLIRFISAHAEQGKASPLLRPRLIGYLGAIALVSVYLGWEFNNRDQLLIEVLRDRQNIYRITEAGHICNDYRMIVENVALNTPDRETVGLKLNLKQKKQYSLQGPELIDLGQGERSEFNLQVCDNSREGKAADQPGSEPLQFRLSANGEVWSQTSSFLYPQRY